MEVSKLLGALAEFSSNKDFISLAEYCGDDPLFYEREVTLLRSENDSYLVVPIYDSIGSQPIIVKAGCIAYVVMYESIESEHFSYGDDKFLENSNVTAHISPRTAELMMRDYINRFIKEDLEGDKGLDYSIINEFGFDVMSHVDSMCKIGLDDGHLIHVGTIIKFDMFELFDNFINYIDSEDPCVTEAIRLAFRYIRTVNEILNGYVGSIYVDSIAVDGSEIKLKEENSSLKEVNKVYQQQLVDCKLNLDKEKEKNKKKSPSVEYKEIKEVVVSKTKKYPEVSFIRRKAIKTAKSTKPKNKNKNTTSNNTPK